jgi:sugar/nucleoside kinase (ribokinase family)
MSANVVDGRMSTAGLDVLAIGNAIVDVLTHCDDSRLDQLGLAKGSMSLIDARRAAVVYDAVGPGVEVSGGSAANTATGVASLGGRAAFVGKVRDDELGQIFAHDLRATGVTFTTPPADAGPETARCLVLVTPDAQRTMCTYLGVAGSISAADIDEELVGAAAITFLEGYLVGLPSATEALAAAMKVAHGAGRQVALTLSDPMWVRAQQSAFDALMDDVDIVLANEREACMLTGAPSAEEALAALARSCPVVVVTRSEHGAMVTDGAETVTVPAGPVTRAVDTTGAGDLFAAGFLLGLTRGMALADCARLGALAAAEVISHLGARPEVPLADLAREAGFPWPVSVGGRLDFPDQRV